MKILLFWPFSKCFLMYHLNPAKTVCFLLTLVILQIPARGQHKNGDTVVYGGDKYYPPYEFINQKGQPEGFHVDLFRAIGEVMGFRAVFKLGDWAAIKNMIEEEKSVDVTDMFFSRDRNERFEFANSHAVISHELITRDNQKNVYGIEDIVGASIVVEKGSLLEDLLTKSELGLNLTTVSSEQEALERLAEEAYDYALVSGYQAHKFIAENKKSGLSPVGPVVFPLELSFVTHKGRRELINDINLGLEILKKTGRYSKIYVKWFGEKDESPLMKALKWTGLSLLVLLALSAFWIFTLRKVVKAKTVALKKELDKKTAAEKKLQIQGRELREAQKMANLGNWKYDFKSQLTEWSEEQKKIFGLEKGDKIPGYEEFLKFIHPQDRKLVTDTFSQAVNKPVIYTFEVRAINKKNEQKNLLVKIKPTYDGTGDKITGLNGTVMDITALKLVQSKLEDKNEQLHKKNLELDKLSYSISHDIQAPVASILGLVNLMKLDVDDEKTKEYVKKIEMSIAKLNSYTKDILAFSVNENKKVDKGVIAFKDIINESFALRKYMDGAGRLKLMVNVDVDGDFVSDKSRLMLVFGNIISNAIKYQKRDVDEPFLKISVKGDYREVQIVVEDNGEGIMEEHLENIFDMFYRGSINSDGSGLGLYIVREVIHKLNGTVHVQSTLHGGTSFMIGLPSLVTKTE